MCRLRATFIHIVEPYPVPHPLELLSGLSSPLEVKGTTTTTVPNTAWGILANQRLAKTILRSPVVLWLPPSPLWIQKVMAKDMAGKIFSQRPKNLGRVGLELKDTAGVPLEKFGPLRNF